VTTRETEMPAIRTVGWKKHRDPNGTLLDAGYFHIRHTDVAIKDLPDSVAGEDTAYLIRLKPGKPAPEEVPALPAPAENNDNGAAHVIVWPGRPMYPIRSIADNIDHAQELTFRPTSTEEQTLRYGLQTYCERVTKVSLLVDDFGLPPGIRNHLNMLVPASYREILADCSGLEDKEPLIISERKTRNIGAGRIRAELRKIRTAKGRQSSDSPAMSRAEHTFSQRGFALADRQADKTGQRIDCGNGALVLCAPYLSAPRPHDDSGFGVIQRPFIALTRYVDHERQTFVPACAVLQMGMVEQWKKAGYSSIISVNHSADDGHIHTKRYEGGVLAALLLDEPPRGSGKPLEFENTVVTLDDFFGGEVVTTINASEIRSRPSLGSLTFEEFSRLLATHNIVLIPDGVNMSVSSIDGPNEPTPLASA
jgi:hypothetical protein